MRIHKIWILAVLLCPAAVSHSAADVLKSTGDDQASVEVTVYNSNIALIKDTRKIRLPKGDGELRFMDVAAHIMPVTVHVQSLNHPEGFTVLEQNYEYDLLDPNKLLHKYVGKDIKLLEKNPYQDTTRVVDAKLLSYNSNQPIYEIDGEIHLNHRGAPILPEIPENLIAKPTLMWLFGNDSSRPHEMEVSYLTRQMSWKADYVLVLNKDDTQGDLSGWVTINNTSGATYKDAALKLVAGEIHRAQTAGMFDEVRTLGRTAVFAKEDKFVEKGFFEYHIYDLQRKTTIKDNQTKQINLLEAAGFSVEKMYKIFGIRSYYSRQYREENPKQPVNVYINFTNSKENRLGMPLPKGIVRFYKEDTEGALQFIGEDNIDHTPKDEEVTLKVGEAFDIVAERKQTDYRRISNHIHETAWEIEIRNRKEEDIVVSVIEPLYGDWEVLNSSHKWTKEDAFTLRFDVPVRKDEELKVTYRVRVTY